MVILILKMKYNYDNDSNKFKLFYTVKFYLFKI